MDEVLDQLGGIIAGILESLPVRLVVLGSAIYVTVVWMATAYWVFNDLRRRTADPTVPYLGAAAVILASPVLLPLAAFTYMVLRPGETLAQARERELTDRLEALEAELDLACPGCGTGVDESWLLCPECRTQLARRCRACGRSMGLDWLLCGWCGTDFGRGVTPERMGRRSRRIRPPSLGRGGPSEPALPEPGG